MMGPGQVPASTIAPTILLENGRVRMVVGSPGSGRIPPAVVQTIVYALDYRLDPLQALRMPRIYPSAMSARVQVEDGFSGLVLAGAREAGYLLEPMPPTSLYFGRLQVIERRNGRWVGAADPRRNGELRGY